MDKKDITEEQHQEFYKLQGGYDTPQYRLQFKVDTPLNINVLLYFPSKHMERWEQRLEPSVNVYSRKVLIQAKSKHILPDWARFIKGVVDSEDIPLNISRETMQDSALISKIKGILVKKIVKFLDDESKKDNDKYMDWYSEFGNFIKEGVINDPNSQLDIARLLRFETSLSTKSTSTAITPSTMNPEINPGPKYKQYSLDEYVSRMPLDQKGIYYLTAPNRELALLSPYYEAFEKKGIEVIFIYHEMDPFLMRNLGEFNKRKLINLERADIEIPKDKDEKKPEPKAQELCEWIQRQLESKVLSVKVSQRLLSSPALIVDHEVAPIRKLYKTLDPNLTNQMFAKQKLEINANHPLIEKLNRVRTTHPQVAKLIIEQIYDNALLAADILDNPRQMIPRLNEILEKSLDQNLSSSTTS
jgi:HSP90 family molecular chaperone